jgi:hypothetical protein
MVKNEIKKNIKKQKKSESTRLIHKTCDLNHETRISS